jgi:hypothetical protein
VVIKKNGSEVWQKIWKTVTLQLKILKLHNNMATATKQTGKRIENEIDWQFPNERETISIDDFRKMVKKSEDAPSISFDEFRKVTDEWIAK